MTRPKMSESVLMIRVSDEKRSFSLTPFNVCVATRLIRLVNKQLSNLGRVPLELFERG